RLLQVPPQDFLELACSQPEGGTKYRLREWITPREFAPPHAGKKAEDPAEDISSLIRRAVREELGADLKKTIRTVVREELTRSETNAVRSESN
ncbi:MAG TPA: hypothetical protein VE078_09185, partial [Thermoanaerobaculia bacterium]|nr:hypothetical protein [Thermoanaerobaculia bacterium]